MRLMVDRGNNVSNIHESTVSALERTLKSQELMGRYWRSCSSDQWAFWHAECRSSVTTTSEFIFSKLESLVTWIGGDWPRMCSELVLNPLAPVIERVRLPLPLSDMYEQLS